MPLTRRLMINELIDSAAMEMLLQDSFANYVIQTSLDYADDDQREQVKNAISQCILIHCHCSSLNAFVLF